MRSFLPGTWLVAIAMALTAPRAYAQASPAEAQLVKEMLHDAIAAEKNGRCDDAIALIKQAQAIHDTPELLLHLGECQAKMGNFLDALKTWEKGEQLSKKKGDEDPVAREQLVKRQLALRERLPTVILRVPADAKGVEIKIDDKPLALDRAASPVELDPGDHKLSATAEGRVPFTTTFSLAERDSKAVAVALPLVEQKKDATEAAATSRRVPLATWVSGGFAAGLTVGGFVTFLVSGAEASSGKSACATEVTCDSSKISAVHTLDRLALFMWIGAGASAGVAVFTYATESETPAASKSVSLVAGPGSLGLRGAF